MTVLLKEDESASFLGDYVRFEFAQLRCGESDSRSLPAACSAVKMLEKGTADTLILESVGDGGVAVIAADALAQRAGAS